MFEKVNSLEEYREKISAETPKDVSRIAIGTSRDGSEFPNYYHSAVFSTRESSISLGATISTISVSSFAHLAVPSQIYYQPEQPSGPQSFFTSQVLSPSQSQTVLQLLELNENKLYSLKW